MRVSRLFSPATSQGPCCCDSSEKVTHRSHFDTGSGAVCDRALEELSDPLRPRGAGGPPPRGESAVHPRAEERCLLCITFSHLRGESLQ